MLRQYKFKILYTLGKDNSRASMPSRRHNLTRLKTNNKLTIFRINKDGLLGLS